MTTNDKFDVAIIGAGIIGCSVAYYLCTQGITNVVLIEKEKLPGYGSTSKANGGIRAQFTTEANICMSLLSMDLLDAMDDEMRAQSGYVKAGYLFVTAKEENNSLIQKSVEFQKNFGVSVELLSREEIQSRFPYVRAEDLVGGSFGSRDGFLDSGGLTNAFYSRALTMGAKVLLQCEVDGIKFSNKRVTGVKTDRGQVDADVVVNAAGPFAAEVAALTGVELPVQPHRTNIAITGPTPYLPDPIPMTIDSDTGLIIRRESGACSIAWTNHEEPPGFDARFDPKYLEHIVPKIEKRFPQLLDVGINYSKCWAGLYPETPDHHAILGESGVSGFLLAVGLGGHGIMHSPAVGCVMSELIAKGKVESLDISYFDLKRFKTGNLNMEQAVL